MSVDVLGRLAELEQRVGELEAGGADVDQLTPGVFSINAAGQLEELLSGKLTAFGIIFELGSIIGSSGLGPGKQLTHEIVWQSEGLTVAALSAYRHSQKPPGLVKGRAIELSIEFEGQSAGLTCDLEDNPFVGSRVTAQAGTKGVTIINSSGGSSFMLADVSPRFKAEGAILLANGAAGTETQIKPAAVLDSAGWWSEATHKYTPLEAGLYVVTVAFIGTVVMAAGTFADVGIFKNGALVLQQGLARCIVSTAALTGGVMLATAIYEMNGTTDTLEIVGNSTMAGNNGNASMAIYRLRV